MMTDELMFDSFFSCFFTYDENISVSFVSKGTIFRKNWLHNSILVFCIDGESTCSAAVQSEKKAKKTYIPRRLLIGNDEYVGLYIYLFFCIRLP